MKEAFMKLKRIISTALTAATVFGATAISGITADEPVAFAQNENVISVYDAEKGYYKGMPLGMTAEEFLGEFAEGHTLKNAKGGDADPAKPIGTDYTLCFGEESRPLVIYGDVNRDAKFNLSDVSSILKHIAKWSMDINLDASDVTLDTKVNLADVSLMLKYIASGTLSAALCHGNMTSQRWMHLLRTVLLIFGSTTVPSRSTRPMPCPMTSTHLICTWRRMSTRDAT